ncbi:hypothetical protein RUM43_003941 [Polyplax serrata]|uniref:Uncharacterized protein n=1 Tax=Polyplax serrata TaxID=468196 RepID=A0AAN8PNT8_POLSC
MCSTGRSMNLKAIERNLIDVPSQLTQEAFLFFTLISHLIFVRSLGFPSDCEKSQAKGTDGGQLHGRTLPIVISVHKDVLFTFIDQPRIVHKTMDPSVRLTMYSCSVLGRDFKVPQLRRMAGG